MSYEWGETVPVLDGPLVRLRPIVPADRDAILAIFGDHEVIQYWSFPALDGVDAADELIRDAQRQFTERRLFKWGICLPASNDLVGTCSLFNLDAPHRRAELGFALGRQNWGRGVASAAVEVLLRFAFDVLALHRIEADVDPANTRSIALLERHGFRREGLLRERWHHLGAIHDAIFLGLLRTDWEGRAPNASRMAAGSGEV